jgi:shikimate dehydrogenase
LSDRYFIIGNPVAHSLSPQIHSAFARETGQDLVYERQFAPLDGFSAVIAALSDSGACGANVTVPFKEEAFRLSTRRSERAAAAEAVNTLGFDGEGIFGDNTDGCGLVADLRQRLNVTLAGKRILVVGAGGATRGVLLPLLQEAPAAIVIANRTADKARALADRGGALTTGAGLDELAGRSFDLIINATSASLSGEVPALPAALFRPGAMAYDMMYGKGGDAQATPFLAWARAQGAAHLSDGLGMLVEQAAEAFFVWRGVRPATAPVLAQLRGPQAGAA